MPLIRPIVAATDFSPRARHAALRAGLLAAEQGAPLALVHVLAAEPLARLRRWLGEASATEEQVMAGAQRQLDELAGELHGRSPVTVEGRVIAGAPIDEILGQADAQDARLVVLGAQGAGYLRRLALGSTAERLLRRSPRPLLVVRQAPHEPYRRALVAVDFSAWSAPALSLAQQTAPQARLVLLSAFQVPFEDKLHFAGVDAATIDAYRRQARIDATERLHALARDAGLQPGQWEECILEGDASLRIVEQEQARNCDLVVLGKHGVSAAVDLLLGSVTKHVLAEGCVDVLISTAGTA